MLPWLLLLQLLVLVLFLDTTSGSGSWLVWAAPVAQPDCSLLCTRASGKDLDQSGKLCNSLSTSERRFLFKGPDMGSSA